MTSTLDRWYVSGPLGVGTTFNEQPDVHSLGSLPGWNIGSAFRHEGWETLNLLDSRAARIDQGPNLNWWGLNAATRAVRLGTISARFTATAEGGSASYLTFYAKPANGDVKEVLRLESDGNMTLGKFGNGAIKTRHVNGKHWQNDSDDALYLNWNTGQPVTVGGDRVDSKLVVRGELIVRHYPVNETTPGLARLSLTNRAAGGAEQTWSLFTAAVGGGWGVTPNGFEIWEYPATRSRFQLRPGGNTILAPAGGNVGIGTSNPGQKLEVVNGGAVIGGVAIGADVIRLGINYPYEYETVGVADPNMNLRLQSPNSIVFHTGKGAIHSGGVISGTPRFRFEWS